MGDYDSRYDYVRSETPLPSLSHTRCVCVFSLCSLHSLFPSISLTHSPTDRLIGASPRIYRYSDAGETQCCSRFYGPKANDGSFKHEGVDATTFAAWGVDLLKHDSCGSQKSSYTDMRDALK